MLEFKKIELSDKPWAEELLSYSDYRNCEYSFGNNFIWQKAYDMQIARYKDFYFVKNNTGFFFPAGRGDLKEAISQLTEYCKSNSKPFHFITMNKASMEWLKDNYGNSFEFDTNRDMYDYVYNFEDLSTLKGKKLHSKRNHINRFNENNWTYEQINRGNIDDCKKMSHEWCRINECELDESKSKEACAVCCGFEHYFELGFVGGCLKIDGRVVAFTFGERLSSNTFVVHVEKAFSDIQGAYPAINYEFVRRECQGYIYINREEDLGSESLRKSKLSYKPIFLEEKFTATLKN